LTLYRFFFKQPQTFGLPVKFRRLERNNNMADEPSPCKTRIDAEAQQALDDVNALLTKFQQPPDLQLGLEDIKQHLDDIKSDPHSP